MDENFAQYEGDDGEEPASNSEGGGWNTAAPYDPATYWAYLEGLNMTAEEKHKFLQVLWAIMVSFVELGFGLDPVQQIVPRLLRDSIDGEFKRVTDDKKGEE